MRALIIDDHPLVREALASVMAQLRPAAELLQAGSARDALALLQAGPTVDLVLLDLRLPDADGLQLLLQIGRQCPGTAVVVLSGDLDAAVVQQALAQGAVGCIPKTEPRDVLVGALGLVLAGGVYVPPMVLAGRSAAPADATTPGPGAGRVQVTPQSLGLTERQLEVLALLMQGKNNKLICRALGLAEPTVKNHVSAILHTLGVDSRTEAVLAVTRLGWTLTQPGQSR